MRKVQDNRNRDERLSRVIESLKAEADSETSTRERMAPTPGYRYPRSRWSAPAE